MLLQWLCTSKLRWLTSLHSTMLSKQSDLLLVTFLKDFTQRTKIKVKVEMPCREMKQRFIVQMLVLWPFVAFLAGYDVSQHASTRRRSSFIVPGTITWVRQSNKSWKFCSATKDAILTYLRLTENFGPWSQKVYNPLQHKVSYFNTIA